MLTPIKKQGDEHIYILLQISITDWVSVRYVDILRFVRMLIGSEITYRDALSILYEVHVKVNHADRDKVLLKKSCHEITLPVEKARFAQALRNSTRTMSLTGYPSTRGYPAGHLMMTCQSFGRTMKCKSPGFYVNPRCRSDSERNLGEKEVSRTACPEICPEKMGILRISCIFLILVDSIIEIITEKG